MFGYAQALRYFKRNREERRTKDSYEPRNEARIPPFLANPLTKYLRETRLLFGRSLFILFSHQSTHRSPPFLNQTNAVFLDILFCAARCYLLLGALGAPLF